MSLLRVYAGFQSADARGRLRLSCTGTVRELARQNVELREGLSLLLYSEDEDEQDRPTELEVAGVVEYSTDESCWVAAIDWDAIRHVPADMNDSVRP